MNVKEEGAKKNSRGQGIARRKEIVQFVARDFYARQHYDKDLVY